MSETAALIDFHGRPITGRDIQRSMSINIFSGMLGMVWAGMTVNYSLALFMEAIGASGVAIGMMMTARLVFISMQIPSALFFERLPERLGSRRLYWAAGSASHRAVWFLIGALALWTPPGSWWLPYAVIGLVGLSELLAQSGAAMWFSWMADLIPHKAAGQFWGRRQALVTVGALAGMTLAGYVLDHFRDPATNRTSMPGFCLVFAIGAAFGVSDILLHLAVKEPRRTPMPREGGIVENLVLPFRQRDFLRFTLAMGGWYAAISMYTPFSLVFLKRDFPVTYSHVAALSIIGSMGAVFTCFFLGKLTDRIGPRSLCAALLACVPLTASSWFFVNASYVTLHLPWIGAWHVPQAVLCQVPAAFLSGAFFAAMFPCQVRLASLLSGRSGRTMAMAVHWAAVGLIASGGSLLGGAIMDGFNAHPVRHVFASGTSLAFFHGIIAAFTAVVWLFTLPLIVSIRAPVDRVPIGRVVTWVVNPFNAIRSLASRWMPEEAGERGEARKP